MIARDGLSWLELASPNFLVVKLVSATAGTNWTDRGEHDLAVIIFSLGLD